MGPAGTSIKRVPLPPVASKTWHPLAGQGLQEDVHSNRLDEGTLYGALNSVLFEPNDTQRLPPMPHRAIPCDFDTKKEKDYVLLSDVGSATKHRLPHILLTSLKTPRKQPYVPYGVPNYTRLHPRRVSVNETSLYRTSSFVRKLLPHLRHDGSPDNTYIDNQYCDVLGPGSCARCIEVMNKSLTDQMQKRLHLSEHLGMKKLLKPQMSQALMHNYRVRRRQRKQAKTMKQSIESIDNRQLIPEKKSGHRLNGEVPPMKDRLPPPITEDYHPFGPPPPPWMTSPTKHRTRTKGTLHRGTARVTFKLVDEEY